MSNRIPVVLCFDTKYAPYASVATYTAFIKSSCHINFYWIFSSDDATIARKNFDNLTSRGIHITLIEVESRRLPAWKESRHITKAAYIRLLIPDLIPEEKIIYLDCDTITLGDLSELYSIDMQESPIAGAFDRAGGETSKIPRLENDIYINSGVLLMNSSTLRKEDFFDKCAEIYKEFHQSATWLDQCLINKFAEGRKLILPTRWNTQTHANLATRDEWNKMLASNEIKILHFVGRTKPWTAWCNFWVSDLWWEYADQVLDSGIRPLAIRSSGDACELANALRKSENPGAENGIKKTLPRKIVKFIPKPLRGPAENIYNFFSFTTHNNRNQE